MLCILVAERAGKFLNLTLPPGGTLVNEQRMLTNSKITIGQNPSRIRATVLWKRECHVENAAKKYGPIITFHGVHKSMSVLAWFGSSIKQIGSGVKVYNGNGAYLRIRVSGWGDTGLILGPQQ